jgi:hypothetical protein
MNNEELEQQNLKDCFGTKEYSKNSGICKKCKLKEDCGKCKKANEKGI